MRLFVSLDLPADVRQSLAAWRLPLSDVRWTPAERTHLTLRFLGETTTEQADAITDHLRPVAAPSVPVRTGELIRLPSARRPRVLAVRLEATPELLAVHDRVETALAHAGVAPESRPLLPHVTLTRLKRPDAAALRRALRDVEAPEVEGVARTVSLVQSERQSDGPRYTPLLTVPLAD